MGQRDRVSERGRERERNLQQYFSSQWGQSLFFSDQGDRNFCLRNMFLG